MTQPSDTAGRTEGFAPARELRPAAPEPPETGDPAVDEVVAALAAVVAEPLEDRLGVLERVHRTLQDRLADVEE